MSDANVRKFAHIQKCFRNVFVIVLDEAGDFGQQVVEVGPLLGVGVPVDDAQEEKFGLICRFPPFDGTETE